MKKKWPGSCMHGEPAKNMHALHYNPERQGSKTATSGVFVAHGQCSQDMRGPRSTHGTPCQRQVSMQDRHTCLLSLRWVAITVA